MTQHLHRVIKLQSGKLVCLRFIKYSDVSFYVMEVKDYTHHPHDDVVRIWKQDGLWHAEHQDYRRVNSSWKLGHPALLVKDPLVTLKAAGVATVEEAWALSCVWL